MGTIEVAVVNWSRLSDAEVTRGVAVLQAEVSAPGSGVAAAHLTPVPGQRVDPGPKADQVPMSSWWALVVLDDGTPADVRAGYRDLTRWGRPLAKVEVRHGSGGAGAWTADAGRALLAMLAGPHGHETATVPVPVTVPAGAPALAPAPPPPPGVPQPSDVFLPP
jgi:hypothetical protein